ncbi:methyltransferase [Microbacterium aerolatum]|uniref:class I SAM-dependent methyltransferase n=1 Tax=Microbacterium aerolatum TaxID=153731 RepID=UPI002000A832|nr:methyltransferase [Microbacterium aerolatum]MCK3770632.1 methyltransferase [Microbacterium aerolatum]
MYSTLNVCSAGVKGQRSYAGEVDFSYASLRRFPDVEAPNLQAWDATDELLVQRALAADVTGEEIAVIGDEYGAITLALADAGRRGVRVHQDLATGRRALASNAAAAGLEGFVSKELEPALLEGARLVLLQLPKSLAALEEIADAVARWAAPDVTLIAGGRVKHMTLAQNEVLGRSFENVQPQRAERKSRLIVASGAREVPVEPPYPVAEPVEVPGRVEALTLVAHGGAFAGARLDIGTRVLLEVLSGEEGLRLPSVAHPVSSSALRASAQRPATGAATPTVVDLGCGTGALAAAFALAHPEAHVIATDRSAAAVASARATMIANGIQDRVTVTHDDAGSEIPDHSADLVLLNPPFHLGSSIHTGAATRLFDAAGRILKPGGELLTVYNSHLAYKAELTRRIGSTEQLHRTPKFTVTSSIRR